MYTGIDTMTASLEVRQLAEKLQAQGIVATTAAAIDMAQSMLETSNKVMKDFNPKYGEDDEPFTNPHKDDDEEDEGHQEEEKTNVQIIKKPELTLHELMGREESHELKFLGDKVHITQVKEELLPMETPKIEPHQPMSPIPEIATPGLTPATETHQSQLTLPETPEAAPEVKPMELPPTPKTAPKNDGLYQKVDLTTVFGKH